MQKANEVEINQNRTGLQMYQSAKINYSSTKTSAQLSPDNKCIPLQLLSKKKKILRNTLASFLQADKKLEAQGLPFFEIRPLERPNEQPLQKLLQRVTESKERERAKIMTQNKPKRYEEYTTISEMLSTKRNQLFGTINKNAFKTHYCKISRRDESGNANIKFKKIEVKDEEVQRKTTFSETHDKIEKSFPQIIPKEVSQEKFKAAREAFLYAKQCFRKSTASSKADPQNEQELKVSQRSKMVTMKEQMKTQMKAQMKAQMKTQMRKEDRSAVLMRKNKKMTQSVPQTLNTVLEPQSWRNVLPLPKKITANSFLIYEIVNSKGKIQNTRAKHSKCIHGALNHKTCLEIASLTKIMTCILVIDICQAERINPEKEQIKIGRFEVNINGTSANLESGQIYTVDQLLYGLMLPSGNDASLALAAWSGRTLIQKQSKNRVDSQSKTLKSISKIRQLKSHRCYNRFIAEMNRKARILGLEKTNYSNSHGLVNALNKSCCLDLAILCEYAMQNEYFRRIVSCKEYNTIIKREMKIYKQIEPQLELKEDKRNDDIEYDIESEEEEEERSIVTCEIEITSEPIKWINTHQLVQREEEYIGIKTGVTTTAGPCLASCLKTKQGRMFVIVVLGSKRLSERFRDTQLLRKWLYRKQNILKKTKLARSQSESSLEK